MAVTPCLLAPVASAPAASSCAGSSPAATLVCDLNDIRVNHGLDTLRFDGQLASIAQALAADMARMGNLSHIDAQGRDLATRVADSHYLQPGGGVVLENIAWGQGSDSTPQAVANLWMQSDPHRANVLDPRVTDVGVAAVPDGGGGVYYAADLGVRASSTATSPETPSNVPTNAARPPFATHAERGRHAAHARHRRRAAHRRR